jgi:hypothetical protein
MFAEYNPIPEEVIHQVDEAIITKGSSKDTLLTPEIPGEDDEEIPFERLFVNVNNIGGSKINITVGQFRNPFGIWSDYSSHRNFTATKNNTLVNGFALKKIELGIKADVQLTVAMEEPPRFTGQILTIRKILLPICPISKTGFQQEQAHILLNSLFPNVQPMELILLIGLISCFYRVSS